MPTNQPSPARVTPPPSDPSLIPDALSRRGFLRTAALAGGGLAAASIAACAPGAAPVWTFGPGRSSDPNAPPPPSATSPSSRTAPDFR